MEITRKKNNDTDKTKTKSLFTQTFNIFLLLKISLFLFSLLPRFIENTSF